jgi:hypothetical protein
VAAFSRWTRAARLLAALALPACAASPPASRFPTAADALARMKDTYFCARGLHGEAAVDTFSDRGRIRGKVLLFAVRPAELRVDLLSPPPFNSIVSTLTTGGGEFKLADLREKRFYQGRASPCAIARLSQVPMEAHALVLLLGGEAPLLVHEDARLGIEWSGRGYYVVRIPSTRGAVEEVHLVPTPSDFDKPWQRQRLRVLDVRVVQKGVDLWHAELGDHKWAKTASALVDPEGLEPPIPPSGPVCDAEVPRTIHVEVPEGGQDLIVRYDDVTLNPPLPPGVFTQPVAPGLEIVPVTCP